jgi:hypothetical protein
MLAIGAIVAAIAALTLPSAGHATGGNYQSVTKRIAAYAPDGNGDIIFDNPCSASTCPATSNVRIDGYLTFGAGDSDSDKLYCEWGMSGQHFTVTLPAPSSGSETVVPLHEAATLSRDGYDFLDCSATGAWGYDGGVATISVIQGNSLVDNQAAWFVHEL